MVVVHCLQITCYFPYLKTTNHGATEPRCIHPGEVRQVQCVELPWRVLLSLLEEVRARQGSPSGHSIAICHGSPLSALAVLKRKSSTSSWQLTESKKHTAGTVDSSFDCALLFSTLPMRQALITFTPSLSHSVISRMIVPNDQACILLKALDCPFPCFGLYE